MGFGKKKERRARSHAKARKSIRAKARLSRTASFFKRGNAFKSCPPFIKKVRLGGGNSFAVV
jgi:hypothetical protein